MQKGTTEHVMQYLPSANCGIWYAIIKMALLIDKRETPQG